MGSDRSGGIVNDDNEQEIQEWDTGKYKRWSVSYIGMIIGMVSGIWRVI